ncbi:2'-5' RNA ligase family protein [Dactylosporangium fulvum]|uniref:2'-5' RNA ligase family protein n=1 Tax=Dactylosporangium fulvum TaxID=53359 RepID=A0ABY5W8X3_9ACTN|nr:2'-5' RNA ligase family protein [Dactylosporangium fulvum]UWP85138.1 2'-5' RNA ligase family protein [Dactylosporangium fulvum]
MALAVCLLFDSRTERALTSLWDRLEEQGVATLRSHTHGSHHPHLSYVVLLRWDLAAVRDTVVALPDRGGCEVTFDALGAFRRGRICLVPAVPADLVARQQGVVEAVRATGALVHTHYEIGAWLPHCSVATRARSEQLPVVATTVFGMLPLTARITRAALIDSGTGELWPLPNVP